MFRSTDQKKKKAKAVKKVFPDFINELTDYNFNEVSLTKCNLSWCIVFVHRHQPVCHESERI